MKAIVDDYGDIGRRLAALQGREVFLEAAPGHDLHRPIATVSVDIPMPARLAVGPEAAEILARYETFKRMRGVEERPITQYMSLEAIREAARLLMGSAINSAENG